MRFSKALRHIRHDLSGYGLLKGTYRLWLKTRRAGGRPRSTHAGILGGDVLVRPGTSDLAVLDQIELHPYIPVPPGAGPIHIMDLGANIGLSVRYWKHAAPLARVVAVEPDAANFRMLERNIEGLADIHLVRAGVWYRTGTLGMDRIGSGTAAYRTMEAKAGGEVEAVTIPQLMERYDMSHVDILKVDIEGSELELFSLGDLGWLDKVTTIAVELHDRFKPGCGDAFFAALQGRKWSYEVCGEMIVCTRRDR